MYFDIDSLADRVREFTGMSNFDNGQLILQILISVGIIVIVAKYFGVLARKIGIPEVAGMIVAGLLLRFIPWFHNFGGKEATHGVLKAHRSLGGTGMREWPGRVLKGKKMSGQMGNEIVTVQNLKVFGTDDAENLIFVEGAVPGSNGTFVLVNDSVKKVQDKLPVPTFVEKTVETVNETEQS